MLSLESPAEPVFQPDPENVAHVAQVAAHQIEPAVGVVAPADGQLLDAVPQPLRDGQNLHVEHVAIDLLPPEQLLGHRVLEELEPALCVLGLSPARSGPPGGRAARRTAAKANCALRMKRTSWRLIARSAMSFILKMAWRDSRASRRRLILFSLSVVFGIAALVALGSFRSEEHTS